MEDAKLRMKELEEMIETLREEKEKKPKFSKWIVMLVILLATIFTTSTLLVFLKVGSEPSTLIVAVFGFLTVEVWSLANIKNTETKKKQELKEKLDSLPKEDYSEWQ